MPVFMLSDF